tara:strand:- start:862 stop:1101 length:240 start_codon:yes stop_codon:yes gene_type:complete
MGGGVPQELDPTDKADGSAPDSMGSKEKAIRKMIGREKDSAGKTVKRDTSAASYGEDSGAVSSPTIGSMYQSLYGGGKA